MAKILIYDHEYLFGSDFKKSLEMDGFSVQETSRLSEVLQYILKEKYDAAILNLQTKNVDSTQVFSAIKMIDNKLQIIIVADNEEPLSSVSSIIYEAFRYFRKPVDYKEIKDTIHKAVLIKSKNK